MSPANSRWLAFTPMLPVMLILLANILSAAVAIQYAPLAPFSRMTAITGFSACLTACAISSVATGLPPGLFISRSIAFISLFSSAFSIRSTIALLLTPVAQVVGPSVVMIPSIGITAMFPVSSSDGTNSDAKLASIIMKIRNMKTLIRTLITLQVVPRICQPVIFDFSTFFFAIVLLFHFVPLYWL